MREHMSAAASPEIFKAYDIRGLYGEQIDGAVAEAIGRAFAHVLSDLAGKPVSELRVGLGRDMRLSAPELSARYREGLLGEGLFGQDSSQATRALVAEWWIEKRELLDLAELFQELFHGESGPGCLRLAMDILK